MNLTVTKSTNQREVEMMFGKAMCAYVNAANINKVNPDSKNVTACMSEYEATARCISMFVDDDLPQICGAIIDAAKEKFGI